MALRPRLLVLVGDVRVVVEVRVLATRVHGCICATWKDAESVLLVVST